MTDLLNYTLSVQVEIEKLVTEGLGIDGAHHKQWYLEEILKLLKPVSYEKFKEDFQEEYYWEDGIPP